MSDFGDDALARREEDLADVMAARAAHAAAATPPVSDRCTRCGATIEPERRELLPITNICGGCATHLARGRR